MKGTDVAGGVVAIHNVPGEGDVDAVPTGHLEVADMIVLGSCIATWSKKIWACIVYNPFYVLFYLLLLTISVPVSDPKSSSASMKGIVIFAVGPLLTSAVYVIWNQTVLKMLKSLSVLYTSLWVSEGARLFRSHDLRCSALVLSSPHFSRALYDVGVGL